MADASEIVNVAGTATGSYSDRVTVTYKVTYDAIPTNFHTALSLAQLATGTPVPIRRSRYSAPFGVNIFAESFTSSIPDANKASQWYWDVEFTRPPEGAPQDNDYNADPLTWPAEINVEYMDRQRVIDKARNLDALSHGDGAGGARAANTEGPIVNAAGKRPDEPVVDTERLEVLVIKKNYASLADIVTRNRTYKGTTNNDTVQGYSPRELRYLLTESVGRQFENGTEYWPGVTRILAEESTDLTLDNVGYEYWSAVDNDWIRAKDKDGVLVAEPIKLNLAGAPNGTTTTTITYRHLDAVAYASLVT